MKIRTLPFVLTLLCALVATGSARAGHVLWTDPGTDNWNDGTNWSGTAVPGTTDTAEIGEGAGSGGKAVVSTAVSNIVNLRLGEGAGENGHLEVQSGGSLTTTSGDLLIAPGGATSAGTITMSGGSLNVINGRLELGQNGVGTITQSDGTFTVTNSHVVMGRGASAVSTINLSGGVMQTTGSGNVNFYMAWDNAGSQAELNVNGTGQLNVAGEMNLGGQGTANVNQTGGTVTSNGIAYVGKYGSGNLSTYDISSGTLNANGFRLAWDQTGSQGKLVVSGDAQINLTNPLEGCGNGIGLIEQTGGTITLTDTYAVIGRYNTGTATYNISDGVLKTVGTGAGANHRFHMAWDHAGNHAYLNLSGNGQIIVNEDRQSGNAGFLIANQGTAEVNVSDNGSITVYGGTDGEGGMSLGLNGNASGTVNQTGGSVTIYDNYLMIGRRSTATGTYNISGGTLETAGASGTTARIYMGWDHAGATGYLNLSGNAAVTTNKDNAADVNGGFYAGERGSAYITIADDASLTINAGMDGEGMSLARRDNSYVHVTQTGGTVTINDQYFIMGRYNSSEGVYDMSGGILQTAGTVAGDNRRFHLAWDSADAKATMNLSGTAQVISNANNVSTYGGFFVANQGTAELNISDNASLTVYAANESEGAMTVGRDGNGVGTVNQSGGSVTLHDKYLMIGRYNNAQGTYNISGGTLTTTGSGDINTYLGWDGAGATGALNVSGTANVQLGGDLQVGYNGTGVVTQTDGQVTVAGRTLLGRNTGSGALNLNGGTFTTSGLRKGSGTAAVSFDGGTLRAGASFDTVLPATVNAGGATFDTNGNDLSLHGDLSGAGGVTKTGAGTLTLSGANNYGGNTVISQGTLKLSAAPTAPVAGMARWFDASNAASITVDGSNRISQWNDLSGNNAHATPQTPGTSEPLYNPGSLNGQGTVFFDANTTNLLFARDSSIRTAFWVFQGASFILTDTSAYHFHRPGDTNPADPLWNNTYASANIRNGQTYVNTSLVNGVSDPMPSGFSLVSLVTTGNVQGDGFNRDRVYHSGIQSFGEVLLYDSVLTDADRRAVEAYLNYKWFGLGTTGNVLPTGTAVSIAGGATLDLNNVNQTIGSLAGDPGSYVTLGAGTLTTGGDGQSTDFAGSISGIGGLVKQGAGTFTLSGANTYAGPTTVNVGTLLVDGSLAGSAIVSGGTLGGTGSIGGLVTVNSGSLAPGDSHGVLVLQNGVTFTGGSYDVEIDGPADYDSLDVTGLVTLGNEVADLNVTLGYYPAVNESFTIIHNDGTDAVDGIFAGLDQWSTLSTDYQGMARQFVISYFGNDGNDVVLTAIPEPSTLAMLLGLAGVGLLGWMRRRRSG